ncbi:hypothetical protein AKJ44_01280 [candidate division MSBL1 archaeon SCGC-AAA261F17]|uniref:Ribbon-helix-helix protein CopG domain-containing protein n=1 Tax=candidate division MSBL1 archaeon SCGC-AAA261F17 TaxID=1698274 RepID=A0A133V6S1_9EURY|nr:hypothetical protein AKJ44_01280 [candidate division MSBL1 archaeon SCGC-AAA261F17]
MPVISARVNEEMKERIGRLQGRMGKSTSDCIREALNTYIDITDEGRDWLAPLSVEKSVKEERGQEKTNQGNKEGELEVIHVGTHEPLLFPERLGVIASRPWKSLQKELRKRRK